MYLREKITEIKDAIAADGVFNEEQFRVLAEIVKTIEALEEKVRELDDDEDIYIQT